MWQSILLQKKLYAKHMTIRVYTYYEVFRFIGHSFNGLILRLFSSHKCTVPRLTYTVLKGTFLIKGIVDMFLVLHKMATHKLCKIRNGFRK